MSYIVPGLELIPQRLSESCWWACILMLERWRQNTQGVPLPGSILRGGMDALYVNSGLPQASFPTVAQATGLTPVPGDQTHLRSILTLESYLRCVGPLILNGIAVDRSGVPEIADSHTGALLRHAVVAAGTETSEILHPRVLLFDPGPVNIGWRGWIPFHQLGIILSDRDHSITSVLYYRPRARGAMCTEPLPRPGR